MHPPHLQLVERQLDPEAGNLSVTLSVQDGLNGSGVEPDAVSVTVGNTPVEGAYSPSTHQVVVNLEGLPIGKHTLRVTASSVEGEAKPFYLPFWVETEPFSWEDATLYFAMVDRFADGVEGPDSPECLDPESNTTWRGGDWVGLKQKIEEGYFSDLGINAIWITSPMDNPEGCFNGSIPDQLYTSYHGYFPTSYTEVEERHGTLEDLKEMVALPSRHPGDRRPVLNHVHDTHPLYERAVVVLPVLLVRIRVRLERKSGGVLV